MPHQCLNAEELQKFVSLLDPEIIEVTSNMLTIHASEGAVKWVWLSDFSLFCINGIFAAQGMLL